MGEVGCLKDGHFQNLEGVNGRMTSLSVANVNVMPDLNVVFQSANTSITLVQNSLYIVNAVAESGADVWTLPKLADTDVGAIIEIFCAVEPGDGSNKLTIRVDGVDQIADGKGIFGKLAMVQDLTGLTTVTTATASTGTALQSAQITVRASDSATVPGADDIVLDGQNVNKPGTQGTRIRLTNRNKQIWWAEGTVVLMAGTNVITTCIGALFA